MSNIIGTLLSVSLISILAITMGIILLGTGNDYALGTMYDVIEIMEGENIITTSSIITETENINQIVLSYFNVIDNLWAVVYFGISLALFIGAYFAPTMSLFTFGNMMYIGVYFILFILDFMYVITVWVKNEVLLNVLPTAAALLPKFTYFLDNMGIIISIQLVLCFVLNVVDFNIITEKLRKNKEDALLSRDEVL